MLGLIRKLSFGALLLVSIFTFNTTPSKAQNTQNFQMKSFHGDYRLGRNDAKTSTLEVTETITAVFPNFDLKHGILRAIPKSYQDHTVSLKINSVKDGGGTSIPYTTYDESGNLVLKIGDADKYVHGQQVYVISYSMKNVVAFFDDHEEFYWNINGLDWMEPIESVIATIHLTEEVALNLQSDRRCFVGNLGSKDTCPIRVEKNGAETIVQTEAENVGPRQTMTVVLGFGPGTFEEGPEIRQEQLKRILLIAGFIILAIGLPVITLMILIFRWRKYGRDPKGRGVIIPQYQAPKELNALSSDYLLEEGLRTEAVTAALIELAIKKYLVIYETGESGIIKKTKKYELELIKDYSNLSKEQKDVVEMIFGASAKIGAKKDMDSLKNQLASKVQKLDKDLGKSLSDSGYFSASPSKVKKKYSGIGIALMAVGFAISLTGILLAPGIGLLLSGLIILLFAKVMPARSSSGVEERDYLLGLKDYIKMAEADRLKFLQSPEGAEKVKDSGIDPKNPKYKVKLFEDLLPYAILFGLEKEWSKQFKDIYQDDPPDWYRGNTGLFTAAYFASSVSSISTASAAAFTSPSSSSSSGLGGGGFSGGGGGGGGGGSW